MAIRMSHSLSSEAAGRGGRPFPEFAAMSDAAPSADRNLLYGILALQMGFLGRDALIRARHAGHPESRARFLLEAEVTGGLEHPGVVPVYGLGTYADGRPFYAMRFVKGDSLKDAIEKFHRAESADRDPGERALAFRKLLG